MVGPVGTSADVTRQAFMFEQRAAFPEALQRGIHATAVVNGCVTFRGTVTVGALSVLGEQGFGLEPDSTGRYLRIPHVGGVQIGDDVEIGALVAIARGTVDDTVIDDGVRIDDKVFIAHNAHIGKNTLVIAQAEISGSVHIGDGCTIGPGAVIREHVTIGDGTLIGLGAVVVKDVPAHVVVAGNPARILRDRDR